MTDVKTIRVTWDDERKIVLVHADGSTWAKKFILPENELKHSARTLMYRLVETIAALLERGQGLPAAEQVRGEFGEPASPCCRRPDVRPC